MIEVISAISGILAVLGVVFNNYRMRVCFVIWFVSNTMSLGIHLNAGLWAMAARDLAFTLLAVHGFRQWTVKDKMQGHEIAPPGRGNFGRSDTWQR